MTETTRTQSLLAAADLFYDLADEMKERLLDALRDNGIDTDPSEWLAVSTAIAKVGDTHARVVLEVLLEEYHRYVRLADEQTDSL